MHTAQQLLFAQRFPFSQAARRIVREENLSLAELPESVIERAEAMVQHAFSGKRYVFELRQSELLLQEILAFPVAKILVSFSNDQGLYRRFASLIANSVYEFLGSEKDKAKLAVSLASDLGLLLDFPESREFFVSMPLQQFLSIPFTDDKLKLVNKVVVHGNVFLKPNSFYRFLRAKSFSLVLGSLPVPVKGLPKRLQSIANSIKSASREREKRLFKEAFTGKVAPDAFPPCIAQMYGQLASGSKLPHMANFTLATFLNSIGMPKQQILILFKKSPNFKERIASYQLDRIAKQNYAPPSCDKIRSYGVCPNTQCNVKHPLSFYRRQLRKQGKEVKSEKQVEAKK